jgi:hypothetical protein
MTSACTSLVLTVAALTGQTDANRPFHFENDIVPILSRYNCNSSGCHGGAEGQNGFKLSVFGSNPEADYDALVKDARGRRLHFAAPEASLLLRKVSGSMPHGGGTRLRPTTREYQALKAWIQNGVPYGDPKTPRVVSLRVEPKSEIMAMTATRQLRVTARFADGFETDVTALAKFQTNHEGMASVSEDGLVTTGSIPGAVAIMASYLDVVDTFRALVPRPEKVAFPALPETNTIDKHVNARLRALNILPSEPADDATFLRRAYLDIIGTLPTLAEAKAFLEDSRADKRARLVDALLERPEYADFWSLIWADILRIDRQALGAKRAYAYHRWVRDSFAANKPFDQFAKELVLAEGLLDEVGPANFFKATSKPGETASSLAQIFLGVRIACAECHHHPFDRWGQTDYYGMVSFFAPLAVRGANRGEFLEAAGEPTTKHPRTGATITAHALGTPMPSANPAGDRRAPLAAWLTSPENPWFAKNLANRLWAHYFGRGIVDPVDDVRDTNPPSNPELLDALAQEVRVAGFDLNKITRLIVSSQAYQRSSRPLPENEKDEMNFSRALFRRIPAEVLLDMVSQSTDIDERFKGMPAGTRAIQLWDSKTPHYFLKLFGRPQRLSTCSCERNHEPSVAQVLHLFNSPEIQRKLSHDRGVVAKLAASRANDRDLVDDLYLTILSRLPSSQERDVAVSHLANQAAERRQAAEDLAWSLLNTLEFAFNH